MDAGVDGITQEISPAQIVHVNVVRIEPTHRPRVNHVEPIAAVLKTSRPIGEFGTVHVKSVATAKIGTECSFGNAPMARGWLGSSIGPLLFLTALLLLRRLGLLRVLSLLGLLHRLGLWLAYGLVLLLLRRFRLLLMLSLLWLPCRFRLLLLLCGLGLLLLLLRLLLLLVFLSVDGNNGCGK
jgi:hypothetical protein